MQKNVTSERYCNHSVNQHDHNRYVISLFAKNTAMKRGLWALYAFNYEIAKTREIVTDTTLGLIRLVWWREALRMIYNMPTEQKRNLDDHPLLPELAKTIILFKIPYTLFDQILLGREFDLEDIQPQSIDGLLTYLDNTNAPLLEITALICGQELPEAQRIALGRASGLTGILRAIPFHAQHNIVMLPSELINKDAVLAGDETLVPQAVEALAEAAAAQIDAIGTLEKGPLKAQQRLARLDLNHIKKCGYAPHHNKYNQPIPFLALKLAL
jgi:NADH dehydrogenase [ubiquinone] 1 alpha subcomplex assembly factor 6